jgi:predicted metal-binding membrane protein
MNEVKLCMLPEMADMHLTYTEIGRNACAAAEKFSNQQ